MSRAVRWKLSGKRTRKERVRQRRNIVLRDAGISARTEARYAVALFNLLPWISSVCSVQELDDRLCDWIQAAWDKGDSIHVVSDGLCGLQHREPWLKRQIAQAWKLFSIWRKLESPDRAPPLTPAIVQAWMMYSVDHHDLLFAGLLGLGFFALLRTGEILNVRAKDLLLGSTAGIVSLYQTKTGQRDNVAEMVHFDDPMTLDILRVVKDLSPWPAVPLWPYSAEAFRNRFRQSLELPRHQ